MGLSQEQIESTLRISLGMPTTRDEVNLLVDRVAHALPRALIQ
jgi:cysteine sulfinate desulfinase/cysteine desulfurase-like protein